MDYFTGQIILWPGLKVPTGWTPCNGRSLPIRDNEALYSIIGTAYGGDGVTSFALPDLQGRIPIGSGQAQGTGPSHVIGSFGGSENVILTKATIPPHTHTFSVSSAPATLTSPADAVPATVDQDHRFYFTPSSDAKTAEMSTSSVESIGGGHPHLNLMPSIGISYIICLNGFYPVKP